jgi:DNA/RNA endonuclease G (NUC1)/membrane protein DedA with SNARE-associated domain
MDDALIALAGSAAALPVLFALVLADAFLVVVPGEAAVTAFGALAVASGAPPLVGVVGIAAAAAFCGDAACYLIGRTVGLDRWRWMRHPRVSATLVWAARRLDQRAASVLFTARFIPFARLAVNLTAGAARMPAVRYLPLVAAAGLVWALYQSVIGAAVAHVLPGSPLAAVVVAVALALGIGFGVDLLIASRARRRGWQAEDMVTAASARPDGYDDAFLDVRVPLPAPAAPVTLLPYLRFSVLLDTERRLAALTAVNIDGGTLRDLPRTGEWRLDPRVTASQQTGPAVYADNDLDRGHLVRRRDPGWGTVAQARAATEATFVYTNAAPQASAFNQSKELWVGLEDHVLQYADATDQRISVFTGAVFRDDDPPYRGIRIPRRFWKVAAWAESGADGRALAAAGFVLDQSTLIETDGSALAIPRLGAFRTFQVPIADVGELTGIDFGALTGADVLPPGQTLGHRWSELDSAADIRL